MRILLTGSMLLLATALQPAAAADAVHGKQLYAACAACHGDDARTASLGPSLKGVVGRHAGSLETFRYSNPMKRSNILWDEANLKDYIANPQAKVKGNRMPFAGVADAGDVDDLVAYLKTLQ